MNVKWLFNPCRRYAADLSLLAAGALAEADRAGLQRHLVQCPACRARLAELKTLAGRLTQDGQELPQVEPPPSLRGRWMTEVRLSTHPSPEPATPSQPAWFTGRRLAWGGIGAMWALILFFRFSAPDAPRPQVMATPPTSLRQILLALRTEPREPLFSAPAEPRPQSQPPAPAATPPRSKGPGNHSTRNQSIA
jgi:anti-sigma factor RsiW